MSKFIQALLAGALFTFICDFFIFLGIKLHYIDRYEIDVYYNVLFADHQSLVVFTLSTLIFGLIIIYTNIKIALPIALLALGVSFSALIPSLGEEMAKTLLMQKDVRLSDETHHYIGDIYYNGRKQITFYDKEIDKMIILDKSRLKEFK